MPMSEDRILSAIDVMRTQLLATDALPRRSGASGVLQSKVNKLDHAIWMLDQMEEFLKEGRREKVMRWLGFVQGVLWSEGLCSIEELKTLNKPV